jgi:hypothetical protein
MPPKKRKLESISNDTMTANVKLRYAGAALETGLMDVRQFGPALVAYADLVETAANVVLGPDATPIVRIRSGLRKGSLIADLTITLGGVEQLVAFGTLTYGMALPHLLQALGIKFSAEMNLFKFLRWLKGRRETRSVPHGGTHIEVHVTGDNNNVTVVPVDVYRLAKDDAVRRAAYAVTRPVEQPGVDLLEFREQRRVVERIDDEDVKAIHASITPSSKKVRERPPTDAVETEEVLTVDLLQGVFSEGESFRFYDGESKFWARITDQEWWAKIHHRTDGYFEGDRMRVKLISRQIEDASGALHREREVTKVLWHRHQPLQNDLFDNTGEARAG